MKWNDPLQLRFSLFSQSHFILLALSSILIMSKQVKFVIQELLTGHNEPIDSSLIHFIDLVYSTSLKNIPQLKQAEASRLHLAAYVAIDRLKHRLNLPDPERRVIPCPPKLIDKYLMEFRVKVLEVLTTPSSSPNTTPRKVRMSPSKLPYKLPTKHLPTRSSPLKSSRINAELLAAAAESDEEEEYIPKRAKPDLQPDSPMTSNKSPEPLKRSVLYDRRIVTLPDFVRFANTFHIPDVVTTKLLNSFARHRDKYKKKTEWIIACGLVYGAYRRINHQLLDKQLGELKKVQDQIHRCQKGGINRDQLELYLGVVDDYVKEELWVRELERDYMGLVAGDDMYKVERQEHESLTAGTRDQLHQNKLVQQLGGIITGADEYHLETQSQYLATWKENALT